MGSTVFNNASIFFELVNYKTLEPKGTLFIFHLKYEAEHQKRLVRNALLPKRDYCNMKLSH